MYFVKEYLLLPSFTCLHCVLCCCDYKVNAKGWGLGQANGKVGWFPADFVDMKPQASVSSSADRKNRYNDHTGGLLDAAGDGTGVVLGGTGVVLDATAAALDDTDVPDYRATVLAHSGLPDGAAVPDYPAVLLDHPAACYCWSVVFRLCTFSLRSFDYVLQTN